MSMNITTTTYHGLDEWVDTYMKEEGLRLLSSMGNGWANRISGTL